MKKWISLMLALVLMLGCAGAEGESGWTEMHCAEENFTTKIPLDGSAGYEDVRGMVGLKVYLGVPGFPPFVLVHRRPKKFNNPQNYLNNTYREFMEDKYGSDSLGMNPAKTWEIGGKKMLGARYMFRSGEEKFTQLQLIEIRDLGDVEYTAVYTADTEEKTLQVLNRMAESYLEDEAERPAEDSLSGGKAEQKPGAAGKQRIVPADTAGQPLDLENGAFWAELKDLDCVDRGGYFSAWLYQEDVYPAAAVESLKIGDEVVMEGTAYTVKSISSIDEGSGEIWFIPEEMPTWYLGFRKTEAGDYYGMIGSFPAISFCTDYAVTLPLPYAFQFAWVDGEDVQMREADDFIRLLREEILTEEDMTKESTYLVFRDGLVTMIIHAEH